MNAVTEIEPQDVMLPADPMVSMIERAMMNPDLPVDRISAMMDMRERQMNKEAEQLFNQAFAAAMAEMPDVPKSGKAHGGRKYSTLNDLIRTARPVLARHGLSLNWQTVAEGVEYRVTAIVRHAMGHSIQTTLAGARDSGKQMNVLQGGGSTETYLKRYTGFSILGLSSGDEVDDDGNSSAAVSAPISADQYRELKTLIEDAGITEAVVCTAERLGELYELPADQFARVKGRMAETIANKAKAKNNMDDA